jgi:hypothetical protein
MSAELLFDEAEHRYEIGGRVLPSVTQVIDRYNDFSMVGDETMANARERGRLVHLVTQLYDEDDLDERSVGDELLPYLAGWKKFKAETGFIVKEIEMRRGSVVLGFAGTLDRFGLMGQKDWVVDIKAGLVPDTAGVQTAAYRKLVGGTYVDHIKRGTVQLKPNGTYVLMEWRREDDWLTFSHMLNVHRWLTLEDKRG